MLLHRRAHRFTAAVRILALSLVVGAIGCNGAEDKVVGSYVRTWQEGIPPEKGYDGENPDRHVLTLRKDGRWTAEHSEFAIQQFDVPPDSGTWTLDGTTLTIRPTELGPMQYTVSGDTLFPRTPRQAQLAEMATGYSMRIGEFTYLLRER
jgi:hypothetical protein